MNRGSMSNDHDLTDGDCRLLGYMLRSPRGVDVAQLCRKLGAAPHEVETLAHKLRRLGCQIDQTDIDRFRLIRTALSVWQDYLDFALTEAPGSGPRRVMVYQRIGSTQDAVRDQTDPRVVILADEQSAGRGRRGQAWEAPPGTAVLFSMSHALDPAANEPVDRVQCIAAVAVAQALEKLSGRRLIQIKWPNDIIVEGRKLAGILVETFASNGRRFAVIGVGINVEQTPEQLDSFGPELRQRITSLREIGSPHDRLHVAAEVIAQIDRLLGFSNQILLLDEWRTRNLMRSQRVKFRCNGQTVIGEVVDLDAEAGLIIRTSEGEMVHLNSATTTII